MGSIVENRYTGMGGAVDTAPSPVKQNTKFLIVVIVCAIELVLLMILLIMVFAKGGEGCTVEDAIETLENKAEPSEERKLIDDFMLDSQEEPLNIFAKAKVNGELLEEEVASLKKWSSLYVEKFSGEPMGDDIQIGNLYTLMSYDEEKSFWRLLAETNKGCARFDFSLDFGFLEMYSLTSGNCDELNE